MLTIQQQNIALREKIAVLKEENRRLREALVSQDVLPTAWGLLPMEACMLRALRAVGPGILHHERAMEALYGMRDDAPVSNIIRQYICKIRAHFIRSGTPIVIETIRFGTGSGWRMTSESCAYYDAAIAAERARWPETTARAA